MRSVRPVPRLLTGLGLALVVSSALTGCSADAGSDTDEASAVTMTKTLSLRFGTDADGVLSLRSGGRLLACTERFDGVSGERVSCAGTDEKLQVIVKDDGASVVAVRDVGGKRGYYTCSRSGDVDRLPATMSCKVATLTPRGTGGLSSPFDSSVDGISVPNTHWVDPDHMILRGMEPRTPEQFGELHAAGVERALVFKNSTTQDDVPGELAAWSLPEGDAIQIPFAWKDYTGFQEPCEQTVEALRFVRESVEAKKKVFFHCTVGEDRTGYLAALYDVLYQGANANDAFDRDMCEHGYAGGNPQKPFFVLGALGRGLTPLYREMAFLVHEGLLTDKLESGACAKEPEVPSDFMPDALSCGTSTTLVP